MKEKDIEKEVCEYAEKLGFLVRKFTSPTTIAVPDRIFWGHSQCFLIEFKSPTGRLHAAQEREIQRIRNHGGKVFIVDNVEDGKLIIDGAYSVGKKIYAYQR